MEVHDSIMFLKSFLLIDKSGEYIFLAIIPPLKIIFPLKVFAEWGKIMIFRKIRVLVKKYQKSKGLFFIFPEC